MTGFAIKDVLAIIPARGGSKGVPRKNIRNLGGLPLIAWTIAAAKGAACIGRIIVSTDDHEIAAVARKYGAEVPVMRPGELAQDDTGDLPVCQHILEHLRAEGHAPDIVAWLRPTAPLRLPADIDGAVRTLLETGADSVRSVSASKAHPYWMKTMEAGHLRSFVPDKNDSTHPNRQSLPEVFALNGAVDIVRAEFVLNRNTMWGDRVGAYIMPSQHSVDIDTLEDFAIAEALLRHTGRI